MKKQNTYPMAIHKTPNAVPHHVQAKDRVRHTMQRVSRSEGLYAVFSKAHRETRRHEHQLLKLEHTTIEHEFKVVLKTRLETLIDECNHTLTCKRIELDSDLNQTIRAFVLAEQEHLESTWDAYADRFIASIRRDYDLLEKNADLPMLAEVIETRIHRKLEGHLAYEMKLREDLERRVDRILERGAEA